METWKAWLSEDAYQEWHEILSQAIENSPLDTSLAHWPLDNITGTYRDDEGTYDRPVRISERDTNIPQVNDLIKQ